MTAPESMWRTRWRAARWSLALWLLSATLTGVATWFWFPGVHYRIDGGLQGLRMVSLVDFILGPVLFLVVYRPHKPARLLLLDLALLICVQIAAMVWGIWRVYSQRPVADVYMLDAFYPTVAADYQRHGVDPARLRRLSVQHPPLLYLRLGQGKALRHVVHVVMVEGLPIYTQTELWQALAGQPDDPLVLGRAACLSWLQHAGQPVAAELQKRFGAPLAAHDYAWFQGRYGKALLVFDKQERLQGSIRLAADPLPRSEKPHR